ncbi:MAG TPA: hypothetical protein VLX44_20050 [Xanthobacteraceae bacterium]|nr:hypothetical protein [Xanthobacteraceae bacterium]
MRKAILFGIAAIPVALAVGPAMKAYGPATSTTQPPIVDASTAPAPAGTTVAVTDPAGKVAPKPAHMKAAKGSAAPTKPHKMARLPAHNAAKPTTAATQPTQASDASDWFGGAQSNGANGTSHRH